VFDKCSNAAATHGQEVLDLLREQTRDLDVLDPARIAQFHAQQTQQLQRQQAWSEHTQQQQLSGQVQPLDLQDLEHDLQQAFAAAAAAERPAKRACRQSERLQQQQQQQQQQLQQREQPQPGTRQRRSNTMQHAMQAAAHNNATIVQQRQQQHTQQRRTHTNH
jgi:hypothetical protein